MIIVVGTGTAACGRPTRDGDFEFGEAFTRPLAGTG